MSVVKRKSVLPIYLVGIVWLLRAFFSSLHRPIHFILTAALSVVVYTIGKAIFPDKTVEVKAEEKKADKAEPKKEKAKPAHSPEIEALITERGRAISEMRRLNDSIEDEKISAQIDRLELVTGKIVDAVVAEPAKLPQIRKFLNYYLPTTLKLLNAYDRMDSTGVSGTNIDGTKGKIEDILETVCAAFEKQLDALYGAEALDISTDITVLEQMLAREGIGGTQLQTE